MMERKKVIIAEKAPKAIGSYSHASVINGIVYTAGQIALDPETSLMVEGDISEETIRVMENLKAVLEAAGSSLEKVLKTTIYITDMNDFTAIDNIYKSYITADFPGRTCIQVSALPRAARVEIDMIASL